jgi:sulfatase modifying factor 1
MNIQVEQLLLSISREPDDLPAWLALADALEESGEDDRAELVRHSARYWGLQYSADFEVAGIHGFDGVNLLLQLAIAVGVRPCLPELENSIGMRFALVPPGSFIMGRTEEAGQRVTLTRPVWVGVHPVTQAQYRRVVGCNPSMHTPRAPIPGMEHVSNTDDWPVESVTWHDAVGFCRRLSRLEAGRRYRLPTEAEWERACRGGAAEWQRYHTGNRLPGQWANHVAIVPGGALGTRRRAIDSPSRVGLYPPNAYGLHDMHGNVWEWCQDWYDPEGYPPVREHNPAGPGDGLWRVVKGGSWTCYAEDCQSSSRQGHSPDAHQFDIGFRIVCEF